MKLRSENEKLKLEVEKLETKLRNSELINQAVTRTKPQLQRQKKASENEKVALEDKLIVCLFRYERLKILIM